MTYPYRAKLLPRRRRPAWWGIELGKLAIVTLGLAGFLILASASLTAGRHVTHRLEQTLKIQSLR